ncbi:MAG: hypothetical protein GY828_06730 [Candidatus Gracilibacteria bacterium]|nr:hypothetical protein [Candidatus Gracilibacteria bacterium]
MFKVTTYFWKNNTESTLNFIRGMIFLHSFSLLLLVFLSSFIISALDDFLKFGFIKSVTEFIGSIFGFLYNLVRDIFGYIEDIASTYIYSVDIIATGIAIVYFGWKFYQGEIDIKYFFKNVILIFVLFWLITYIYEMYERFLYMA